MNWLKLMWSGVVALTWWAGASSAFAQFTNKAVVVDLLVVYTPAAREAAGGSDAICSQIQSSLLEANFVFQNSRVNARLRLARAAEVDYVESGSVSNDLERLRNPHDGFLDDVPSLREQCAADLACLVTETGSDWDFYGLQGPSAANAFSVIRRRDLVGRGDLPVALSFNFGCQLERPYADSVGAFPYSYGYSFQGDWGVTYSTVEAFSGQRLPFFSNPDILWQSSPAGVSADQAYPADNARTLNQTAPIVGAFRGKAVLTVPPSVHLISPTNGASIAFGDAFVCKADATDADGTVARVDFFAGEKLIGTVSNAPFRLVCSSLPVGQQVVAAVATDNQGAQSVELATIMVRPANDDFERRQVIEGERILVTNSNDYASSQSDEPPPTDCSGYASVWFTWTAPASGLATVSLQAELTPDQCNQRILGIYVGDTLTNLTRIASACDDCGAPTVSFSANAGTTYSLMADSAGQPQWWSCSTGPFTFQLRLSTLRLSAPSDGAQFLQGTGIPITVTSSASDGAIVGVDFYADEALLGTVTNAPFSLLWTNAPLGSHVLRVLATNDAGEMLGTVPVTVIVHPANSTLRITEPADGARFANDSDVWIKSASTLNEGQIARMDFFDNGGLLGSVTNSPYNFLWTHIQGGAHALTIVSTDDFDTPHSSPPVSISVRPANDDFIDAFALIENTPAVNGSNIGATSEPGDPTGGDSIWWTWTAPSTGRVRLEAVGSGLGPVIQVYTGNELSNLVLCAAFSSTYWYTIANGELDAQGGETYQITVTGSWWGTEGDVTLSLLFAPHPFNDSFADRTVLSAASFVVSNTIGAASSEIGEPGGGKATQSIWWSWTATNSGQVTLVESGTCGTRVIGVYTGEVVSNLTDVVSGSGIIHFNAESGTIYQIVERTGNCSDLTATARLRLESLAPSNDLFTNRSFITGVPLTVSNNNLNATSEPEEPTWRPSGRTLWWAWTAPETGMLTISTDGSSSVPMLSVFTGTNLTNLVYVVDNKANWWETRPSSVQVKVHAGQTYSISADGDDSLGAVVLNFKWITISPFNDDFADRAQLWGANASMLASLGTATLEPGETQSWYPHSVWWAWTAPYSGSAKIWTGAWWLGSRIYTGNALTNLVLVADNTNEAAMFHIVGGVNYVICITGPGGDHQISLDSSASPANDFFANRAALRGTNLTISGVSFGASHEPGEPNHAGVSGTGSEWCYWQAPTTGCLRLSGLSGFSPIWAVYRGDTLTNLTSIAAAVGQTLKLRVERGLTYQIAVDSVSWPSARSSWSLAFAPGPDNDDFANAAPLTENSTSASVAMANATMEMGEPLLATNALLGSVWYSWAAPATGMATVTNSAGSHGFIGIFTGNELTNLTWVVSSASGGAQFKAEAGISYRIVLQSVDMSSNTVALSLSFVAGPPNDDFSNRTALIGWPLTGAGTLTATTREPGEPLHGTSGDGQSVWYSLTAPSDGWVRVNASADGWAPTLAAYTGTSLTNLSLRQQGQGALFFVAQAEEVLQLAVASDSGLGGAFTLALTLEGFPANDMFQNATAVAGLSSALQGSNVLATQQPQEPVLSVGTGTTVWWSWTAPADGSVTITDTGSRFGLNAPSGAGHDPYSGPLIGVFVGASLTNLVLVGSNSCQTSGPLSDWSPPMQTLASLGFHAIEGNTYHL